MKRNVKKDTSKFISFFSPVATRRAIHDYMIREEKEPTSGNEQNGATLGYLLAETRI
jgi:hypothetical protein